MIDRMAFSQRSALWLAAILASSLLQVSGLWAKTPQMVGGLAEVPFQSLSSTAISPLGKAALGIRPNEWKHAETANFIYHYFQSFIATPVSVEAEFFYRIVAKELEKDTAQMGAEIAYLHI
jgi:hypothetical protein